MVAGDGAGWPRYQDLLPHPDQAWPLPHARRTWTQDNRVVSGQTLVNLAVAARVAGDGEADGEACGVWCT